MFHIDLLTPYQEIDFHGPNFVQPPPDLIDGEEEYEVEQSWMQDDMAEGARSNI